MFKLEPLPLHQKQWKMMDAVANVNLCRNNTQKQSNRSNENGHYSILTEELGKKWMEKETKKTENNNTENGKD